MNIFEEMPINIYIVTDVQLFGPYTGKGAYAAVLERGGYTRTIQMPVNGTTDRDAMHYAICAALASLKKDGMDIVIHTTDKPFAQSFLDNIKKCSRYTHGSDYGIDGIPSFNMNIITAVLMSKHRSVSVSWHETHDCDAFLQAKRLASQTKWQTWYPERQNAPDEENVIVRNSLELIDKYVNAIKAKGQEHQIS